MTRIKNKRVFEDFCDFNFDFAENTPALHVKVIRKYDYVAHECIVRVTLSKKCDVCNDVRDAIMSHNDCFLKTCTRVNKIKSDRARECIANGCDIYIAWDNNSDVVRANVFLRWCDDVVQKWPDALCDKVALLRQTAAVDVYKVIDMYGSHMDLVNIAVDKANAWLNSILAEYVAKHDLDDAQHTEDSNNTFNKIEKEFSKVLYASVAAVADDVYSQVSTIEKIELSQEVRVADDNNVLNAYAVLCYDDDLYDDRSDGPMPQLRDVQVMLYSKCSADELDKLLKNKNINVFGTQVLLRVHDISESRQSNACASMVSIFNSDEVAFDALIDDVLKLESVAQQAECSANIAVLVVAAIVEEIAKKITLIT